MSIFENNLKLLSNNNPVLAEKIRNHVDFKSEFALEDSKSGDPNLKKNGYFLHDKFDPEQEAINFLKDIKDRHANSFNFIYGLGLGYVLKRFNKAIKGFIIVYESDLDVLRLTFEMVDFSDELSNPKVFIFDNFNDIELFYEKYFFDEYAISSSIANTYKENDFENAQEFVNHLGYIHGIYDSNYKTYKEKHHTWVKSLVANLKNITEYDEVCSLRNIFKNKPGLIISAGPSLSKNIDLIAKYQNNFVIYCVGTALKTVLNHGITPDFICFVEFHPITAKMMEEPEGVNSNIILQPITYKGIFERPAKNKFVFYADNDEASKWAAKKFSIQQKDYINRGTVSVNALASAKIMGCNPIVLVGQDLAYTGSKCYVDGAIYDNYVVLGDKVCVDNLESIIKKTNLSNDSINNRAKFLTKQLYHVKGQNGETLVAPGDYASFIKYFEDIAIKYSVDTKLINATEGGAQINGYENMIFQNVVDNYANIKFDKTISYKNSDIELHKKIIKNEISHTLDIFDNFYKVIFEKGYEIASQMQINYSNSDNFKIFEKYIPMLLQVYKELRLLQKSDLLELLMVKNTFFIDHYLLKISDITNKNCLVNHLHCLFNTDYKKFILPEIEVLRNTIIS